MPVCLVQLAGNLAIFNKPEHRVSFQNKVLIKLIPDNFFYNHHFIFKLNIRIWFYQSNRIRSSSLEIFIELFSVDLFLKNKTKSHKYFKIDKDHEEEWYLRKKYYILFICLFATRIANMFYFILHHQRAASSSHHHQIKNPIQSIFHVEKLYL